MRLIKRSEKNRSLVVNNICDMLEENTGVALSENEFDGIYDIVSLLESKEARIFSPLLLDAEAWVVAQTNGDQPLMDGRKFEFATIVLKDKPFEKELINTYFDIFHSNNLTETYRELSESNLMLNF